MQYEYFDLVIGRRVPLGTTQSVEWVDADDEEKIGTARFKGHGVDMSGMPPRRSWVVEEQWHDMIGQRELTARTNRSRVKWQQWE